MASRLGRIWIGLLGSSMALLAASTAPAQTAGREPQPGSPLEGGVTYIDLDHPVTASGELRLWRVVSSEGARVMLKVFRPEGDRLLLVGSSALQTVPAGGVATYPLSVPVARNDLIGCFCPDSSCADAFADGLVLSAAGDVGTSPSGAFATGTGSPSIFAAGSYLVDVPVDGLDRPGGAGRGTDARHRRHGVEDPARALQHRGRRDDRGPVPEPLGSRQHRSGRLGAGRPSRRGRR